MIKRRWWRKTLSVSIGLACTLVLMWISGCSTLIDTRYSDSDEEAPAPVVTIREFPDVPIPKELNLDKKESFVYKSPNLATGLLVYHGNVDYDSLVTFFNKSLTQNGWILRASLKYPRTLLFYQKETSVCLITMRVMTLNLRVEIWVAPLETLSYEAIPTR